MPRKKVGNLFLERARQPSLPGLASPAGNVHELDGGKAKDGVPQTYYSHPNGALWIGDCAKWLESLEAESVDLIFADPPYSIGKADWDEFDSRDAYVEWSLAWIERAARALKPRGSLYVCGYSEILADLRRPAARFFAGCRWLVWFYRNRANLSADWGRSHESILHYRKGKKLALNVDDVRIPYGGHTLKYPDHPQAESSQFAGGRPRKESWKPHPAGAKPRDVFEIPVTGNGMPEKTPHPTQKPEELLRRIILASSKEGDVVADPFAGSGTTLVCAEQLRRKWKGCEIDTEYCSWAVMRLENVPRRSVRDWIEMDRENARRREAIR